MWITSKENFSLGLGFMIFFSSGQLVKKTLMSSRETIKFLDVNVKVYLGEYITSLYYKLTDGH